MNSYYTLKTIFPMKEQGSFRLAECSTRWAFECLKQLTRIEFEYFDLYKPLGYVSKIKLAFYGFDTSEAPLPAWSGGTMGDFLLPRTCIWRGVGDPLGWSKVLAEENNPFKVHSKERGNWIEFPLRPFQIKMQTSGSLQCPLGTKLELLRFSQ